MACSLKSGVCFPGLIGSIFMSSKTKGVLEFCPSFVILPNGESKQKKEFPVLGIDFWGKSLLPSDHQKGFGDLSTKASSNFSVQAQASICLSRGMRWWEKTLKPNMVQIHSAQELANTLVSAGDRLVIIDFYSPGCGGCKALHPKICQLAEANPNAIFLEVNYEELKPMCHCLHIHVLPFFRFYRGAEGRLCSFSCTNATIKKFKDALAKHRAERCSLWPAKGLDESEMLKLASIGELSMDLPLPSTTREERLEDSVTKPIDLSSVWGMPGNKTMDLKADKAIV